MSAPPTSVAAKKPSVGDRVAGLFFVILVHGSNSLFLFFLMPRIIEMLESMGEDDASISSRPFMELGQFVGEHGMIALPVLIGFAVWNGWAICSSKTKQRKLAWLAIAAIVLFFLAMVIALALNIDLPILMIKQPSAQH